MPHPVSLVFNTVGLVSNIYALCNMHANELESPLGVQYQYLTVIGLLIATVAFGLKIMRYFIPKFSSSVYEIITNIATPLEGLITVLYWSLTLVDPHLIIPGDVPDTSLLVDCAFHLFPALFLWIDFLAFEIDFKRSNAHVRVIYGFAVFYFLWAWFCYQLNGFWVYPFLDQLSMSMRAAVFATSGVLCWAIIIWSLMHGNQDDETILNE
ncbi:FAR-17a/AIG1-like protein [Parasitella parasitica]|nr:FAR-17a/AIG1-like protein [Parasitella parasitica]